MLEIGISFAVLATVFFVENLSVCKPGSQVVDPIWMITIEFGKLFGEHLNR